jgi:hypothetical protein
VQNAINGVGIGTVYIQVIFVDYPPVPQPDNATTLENVPVVIDVLANDFDVDDPLFIKSVTFGLHGNVTISDNADTVTYTPYYDYSGWDNFTYVVSDGTNEAETYVTVYVEFVNKGPVAHDDDNITVYQNTSVTINVVANDYDRDGDNLTVIEVYSSVNNGSTYIDNNKVVFTPQLGFVGNDSFVYNITDGHGLNSSDCSRDGSLLPNSERRQRDAVLERIDRGRRSG